MNVGCVGVLCSVVDQSVFCCAGCAGCKGVDWLGPALQNSIFVNRNRIIFTPNSIVARQIFILPHI